MSKMNNYAAKFVISAVLFFTSSASAQCPCTDVKDVIDRGLLEKVIREAQSTTGAFRSNISITKVELCSGKVNFEGSVKNGSKFHVSLDAPSWKNIVVQVNDGAE
jgi:hypothetical protein